MITGIKSGPCDKTERSASCFSSKLPVDALNPCLVILSDSRYNIYIFILLSKTTRPRHGSHLNCSELQETQVFNTSQASTGKSLNTSNQHRDTQVLFHQRKF